MLLRIFLLIYIPIDSAIDSDCLFLWPFNSSDVSFMSIYFIPFDWPSNTPFPLRFIYIYIYIYLYSNKSMLLISVDVNPPSMGVVGVSLTCFVLSNVSLSVCVNIYLFFFTLWCVFPFFFGFFVVFFFKNVYSFIFEILI